MKLVAVVAMDERGGIGYRGGLPWHLPADLKRFRALTMGSPVIMGRGCWESLSGPLTGRKNIILSTTLGDAKGALVAGSVEAALGMCKGAETVFIVGGAGCYKAFESRLGALEVTRLPARYMRCDTFYRIPRGFERVWHEHREADKQNMEIIFERWERKK